MLRCYDDTSYDGFLSNAETSQKCNDLMRKRIALLEEFGLINMTAERSWRLNLGLNIPKDVFNETIFLKKCH